MAEGHDVDYKNIMEAIHAQGKEFCRVSWFHDGEARFIGKLTSFACG